MQLEKGFTFPNGIPGLPQIRLVDHSIGAVFSSNTSIYFGHRIIKMLIVQFREGVKTTRKSIFFEECEKNNLRFIRDF